MNALVAAAPPRSIIATLANKHGMEAQAFEATLRATVVKQATREEFAAFCVVANSHNLNPLTREIFAYPAKGGGIVPLVSVDGWARIINDHPMFDGVTFHEIIDPTGNLEGVTCRIYRKDRNHPTEVTEWLKECMGTTEPWKRWPRRMNRHKALIQCARLAFGFSGIYDEDEYDRMVNVTPIKTTPVALHGGFDEGPAVTIDKATGEVVEEVDVVETDVEAVTLDEPIPLHGVQAWADWLVRELPNFGTVDALRIEWDSRKDELREVLPDLWKQVNHSVANRAMVLGGGRD